MSISFTRHPSAGGSCWYEYDYEWGSNYPYTCYRSVSSGYSWNHWYCPDHGTDTDSSHGVSKTEFNNGITMHAYWDAQTTYYDVTWISQAGGKLTIGGNTYTGEASLTKASGSTLTCTAPETVEDDDTLWTFSEWYSNNGGHYSYSTSYTHTFDRDETVTAKYSATSYHYHYLYYNANEGSGAPGTQSSGKTTSTSYTFTISSTKPTRSGYTFDCWNTKSDGSGTDYDPGDTISVSGSTTLYAQWKQASITFVSCAHTTVDVYYSGSTAGSQGTKLFSLGKGESKTINGVTPGMFYTMYITGYDTAYDISWSGATVSSGISWGSIQATSYTGYTLSTVADTKSFTFNLATDIEGTTLLDGNAYTGGSLHYNTSHSFGIVNWNQNKYNFNYWLDSDGNIVSYYPNDSNFCNFTMPAKDYSIRAKGSLREYDIDTEVSPSGAGRIIAEASPYYYGESYGFSATANDGYTFDHWEDGSTDNPRTYTCTGDATLTAYFTENPQAKVTVVASPTEGGTVSGGGTYAKGTSVTLTATPNEGYDFLEWSDGNTDLSRKITVSSDVTYTAYFELQEFEVTTDVYNNHGGEVDGADTYEYGEKCHLYAYPMELHEFLYWQTGDSSNPLSFRVYDDEHFTAIFGRKCKIFIGESRLKEVFIGDSTLSKITIGDNNIYLY